MPTSSCFENNNFLLKLCDLIRQMKIDIINADIVDLLCDELELPKEKKVKGDYIYRKKVLLLFLNAKNFATRHGLEVSPESNIRYITEKRIKPIKNSQAVIVKDYEEIQENLYQVEKPEFEDLNGACHCIQECGINCENRLMCIECTENCLLGNKCGNQVLQKGINVPIEVYRLENGHSGLRSKTTIQSNQIISEYIGEVIDHDMMIERQKKLLSSSDELSYFMKFYENLYLDAKFKGNISRFANHSCNPNCKVFIFNSANFKKVAIVSSRIIQLGEPITFFYGSLALSAKKIKCFCGSSNCKGVMPW